MKHKIYYSFVKIKINLNKKWSTPPSKLYGTVLENNCSDVARGRSVYITEKPLKQVKINTKSTQIF